jgi:hypothetical protein
LRANLTTRGVHPDVLRFCREELLADNYPIKALRSPAESGLFSVIFVVCLVLRLGTSF